jgi:hypothetical protein
MHFIALVVTTDKPTEEVLDATLSPFSDDAANKAAENDAASKGIEVIDLDYHPFGHFDYYQLGGRYIGLLNPVDGAETIKGSDDPHPVEAQLMAMLGGKIVKPGYRGGTGVDALRIKDAQIPLMPAPPSAMVINGQWHQAPACPILTAASMAEGFRRATGNPAINPEDVLSQADQKELAEERNLNDQWCEKCLDLTAAIPDDHWISVIDCHH